MGTLLHFPLNWNEFSSASLAQQKKDNSRKKRNKRSDFNQNRGLANQIKPMTKVKLRIVFTFNHTNLSSANQPLESLFKPRFWMVIGVVITEKWYIDKQTEFVIRNRVAVMLTRFRRLRGLVILLGIYKTHGEVMPPILHWQNWETIPLIPYTCTHTIVSNILATVVVWWV